jgi:hypothetical protein
MPLHLAFSKSKPIDLHVAGKTKENTDGRDYRNHGKRTA